jgi:ADP-heptose:LPS heptosyltransferase
MTHRQDNKKRILVRRSGAIGDVLLATAILPALAKRYPEHVIDFETSFKEIVENNPFVERVVSTGCSVKGDYDSIFDLDLSYEKQPQRSILGAYAHSAGISEDEMRLFWSVSERDMAFARSLLVFHGLEGKNLVAIQSGASFWLKAMDPTYLETLISQIGKRFDVTFILLGSAGDPLLRGAVDLRGKTGITRSAALLACCRAFIGPDSSLLHFAKAMEIPVAAFFGHSDPQKRMIPNKRDCPLVSTVSCRFCYHRQITPAIISVCERQSLVMRLLDSVIRAALRMWYAAENRFARRVALLLLSFQNWREGGRQVAYCMKDLGSPPTMERLVVWMQEVVAPKKNGAS